MLIFGLTFAAGCVMDHPHECSNPTWAVTTDVIITTPFFMSQLTYTGKKLYRRIQVIIGMLLSLETES
jgi:hypothetical protein